RQARREVTMRVPLAARAALAIALTIALAQAQAQPPPPPPASASPPEAPAPPAEGEAAPEPPAAAPPAAAPASTDATRGERMRAYHAAMQRRRLGSQGGVPERLSDRVAEAEALISTGRHDEAIARLTEMVEHPRFASSAE